MIRTTRWGTTVDFGNSKKLLENNLNDILGGYENGMMDYGEEEYPQMTLDECWKYCVPSIYDQMSDGHGYTGYRRECAKHLKLLGNDYIRSEIKRIAKECGILKGN